ncbi:class I SAM-dependent methyltransferase [Pleurocapsa sp. PCC 7319]|uniref:class I SAM-dependent methyltransferase n=1 Tax=Pleurocapsa sp. PCC 7319 TaxID=118161 RepID=UPI00034D1375|nr:class I SAM-dependent methyltransferase [Pleurocapsa sp. PCC 7319]
MTLYNSIGQGYNCTRQADPRIVEQLVNLLDLPPEKVIADVGAGTGNYTGAIANLGYQVIAIEPSEMMQTQAKPHPQVTWITAVAEKIPLADNAVDGAIVMLALHHFSDLTAGIREINRIVANGKIVIFAFEQSKIADFWLTDYFPYFIRDTLETFPDTKAIGEATSLQKIAKNIHRITQKKVKVLPFLLPADLKDLFAAAGWCKPEIYLNPDVRNGISTFSKMPLDELELGIKKLTADLDNGVWELRYGQVTSSQTDCFAIQSGLP